MDPMPNGFDRPPPPETVRTRIGRHVNFALGLIALTLGIIGAFLPLLPTTVFLIIAAWFFGRSSTRLEAWLLAHPRFGSTIIAWRREGAISAPAKAMACSGMAIGFAIFHFTARTSAAMEIAAAVLLLACALYVLTRPRPGV